MSPHIFLCGGMSAVCQGRHATANVLQIQLPCLPQRGQLGLSPNLLVTSCSVAVKDVMEGLSLLTTSNGFHSIMQELHCASENEIHSLCMAYGTEGVCVVMCV